MRSEDIAKLAGVSRSTVSRVINNYPNVPPATREKVLKVIEQHQYQPNSYARALAGKGTNTIGLFVVSTAEKAAAHRIYQNNYFAPFVESVVDTANSLGYYVLIHTLYALEDYQKVKQACLQKRIDGAILVGTRKQVEVIRDLVGLEAPIVLIDYDIGEIISNRLDRSNVSVINSKDYDGATEAVNYLISLGHRKIGMINGSVNTFSGSERYKAYESVLESNRLPVEHPYILNGEFLKQSAYHEVKGLLASGQDLPTAFFAANDDMAAAAYEAFKEFGLSIPEDISIVGFDDGPIATQLVPKLTTVRVPIYDMSKEAVHKVVALCEQTVTAFSTVSFPAPLIARDSCRKL